MSPTLRIVLGAVPAGPWSIVADCLKQAGADILIATGDGAALDFPDGWVPDAVVLLPQDYSVARFDQLDLDIWCAQQETETDQRFALSQRVFQMMASAGGGAIVHVVDARALPGATGQGASMIAAYAAAGLSRGTALDMRERVASNVVAVSPNPADMDAFVAFLKHLCGPAGRAISGQMALIEADRLQLFCQPRPVRIGHSDGPWSEAALAAQVADWADDLPRLGNGRQQ
ncbi:hypothetical protein JHC09_08135 [Devosia sp. MC532]|uniref:hypothetical protein n=1 Tax=Devosia sp. MC532 TaxID=2799788 RepID=UPI0018F51B5D|nr:hypothetical protein [Devosia sp. MC532]MBJ7577853.1 hypothetical protein [Devosia sp. MC532]